MPHHLQFITPCVFLPIFWFQSAVLFRAQGFVSFCDKLYSVFCCLSKHFGNKTLVPSLLILQDALQFNWIREVCITSTHIHRQTDRQRDRNSDTQTHRHTDTWTASATHSQTKPWPHPHWHTKSQSHRHTATDINTHHTHKTRSKALWQTARHTDTQTD